MRLAIIALLLCSAVLAALGAWRQWLMFGTPERTLETMVSAVGDRDFTRCYSRASLSLMKKMAADRDMDGFRFSMLTSGDEVRIISKEVHGPEALLTVRVGGGLPYELRFVREWLGWKFDISDKLSAALMGRGR